VLTSLQTTNASTNELTFDFGSFTHGHIEQDAKGALQSTVTGWDFVENKAVSSPPLPVADVGDKVLPEPQIAAGADLNYYVHFDGMAANTWLALDSFSMGLSSTSFLGSGGGGAGAGKVTNSDVQLSLGSSAEILKLTAALDSGKYLQNVEIEAYAPGGDKGPQLVDEFKFDTVVLTSLQTTNASTNELTFDFGSFTHGHIEQDAKGALQSTVTGWDFVQNHAVLSPPLPDPDLFT